MKILLKHYEPQFRRYAFLIILYSIPAWLTLRSTTLNDADVWWHLRTGQWIMEHRWVPYNDWFSSFGMGKPWAAYSWLFEVLIYALVSRLGLVGLIVYVYGLSLAIAAALFSLLSKFNLRLVYSVSLTALALFAFAPLYTPRPWLFTILFFIIELNVLVSVRRTRRYLTLCWLLPLFALWANLHIQFVYGFLVLAVAALEGPLKRLLRGRTVFDDDQDQSLPWDKIVLTTLGCLVAILVNPYHLRIYAIIWDTLRLGGLYELISELQALQFRSIPEWIVLLLTLGAAFAIGRRRAIGPFWVPLFLIGAFLSFRSVRDSWFVVVIAAAVIANSGPAALRKSQQKVSSIEKLIVAGTVSLLILTFARTAHLSETNLQSTVARIYPSRAAQIVEERRYQGPLYNHFDWGGYLIWRLPELPVSIDGRSNLHNPERIKQSLRIWDGEPAWASDNELTAAHIVIAQRNLPLTQLLRLDSRFEQVYEDQVAVVFVLKSGR